MTQLTTAASALADALETVLGPGAVVASAGRERGGENLPDLTVVSDNVVTLDGAYSVPPIAALATIDILSPNALTLRGELLLDTKRATLAANGVPLHVEINVHGGLLTLWVTEGGTLVRAGTGQSFICEALGNAVIEVPGKGVLKVFNPEGKLVSYYDASAAKAAKIAGLTYDAAEEAATMASTVAGGLELVDAVVLP